MHIMHIYIDTYINIYILHVTACRRRSGVSDNYMPRYSHRSPIQRAFRSPTSRARWYVSTNRSLLLLNRSIYRSLLSRAAFLIGAAPAQKSAYNRSLLLYSRSLLTLLWSTQAPLLLTPPPSSEVPPGIPQELQRGMAAVVLDYLASIYVREGEMELALRAVHESLVFVCVCVRARACVRVCVCVCVCVCV
jgi:hypothetical protein